jgi:phage shock protein PspC (stress-responsive transcriptional regulator)
MKKTVSVNIKGMNFLIEEDAFDLLQNYMLRLTKALRNEKGSKEIIEDIEMRIAELCTSRLNDKKQVIEIEDIELILETLGDPAMYVDEESQENTENTSYSSDEKTSSSFRDRHLYRDLDNASIAGVCAGIANFFSLDVIIIRAIFVVMFFFGGFGFPLYVILWIVVPKAKSTIEKLRMRGKPITVDSVKEEVENAARRFESETKSFAQKLRRDDSISHQVGNIGRIFSAVIGVMLIMKGLFFLIIVMVFGVFGMRVIPAQTDYGFLSLPELAQLAIDNPTDYSWGYAGALIAAFSIILFLLILGVRLVFRIQSRWTRISFITLFISGFIGSMVVLVIGLKTGREMSIEGEMEREVGSFYGETLYFQSDLSSYNSVANFKVKSDGDWGIIGIHGDTISETGIDIHYRQSKDSLFHVYQNLSAHGHSHKIAIQKAKNIHHIMSMDSNLVQFNNHFTYPLSDKLRDQGVAIYIEIPKDKTVQINKEVIRLSIDESNRDSNQAFYEEHGRIERDGRYHHWK